MLLQGVNLLNHSIWNCTERQGVWEGWGVRRWWFGASKRQETPPGTPCGTQRSWWRIVDSGMGAGWEEERGGWLISLVGTFYGVCGLEQRILWRCQKEGIPGYTGKEPTRNYRRLKRHNFDPRVGKIPWRRAWHNRLQYSCLENPMDRGAWQVTVHGVTVRHKWRGLACMHACQQEGNTQNKKIRGRESTNCQRGIWKDVKMDKDARDIVSGSVTLLSLFFPFLREQIG